MAGISDLLNQVWAKFRKDGVTDDITIIGQVAEILLTIQGKSGLISQSSTQKAEVDRSRIIPLVISRFAVIISLPITTSPTEKIY